MVQIIDCAFQDIDKLRMFLGGRIINQLNKKTLQGLAEEMSYYVPVVFLTPEKVKFTSVWYTQSLRKVSINFGNLSREFTQYLYDQFHKYYCE
ncbi:unnamed protein product [Adineta steineri]|uniref:Uncharacterized protein n=1 Tax=Adineta steineri TaxID=433720 RepID=A0A814TCY6_9BILA|nr:unnamed protein product [Adineta steineri]CAF1159767.1 unnamed protein product [Adineta steineri]